MISDASGAVAVTAGGNKMTEKMMLEGCSSTSWSEMLLMILDHDKI